jgi:hypothetical protein
MQQVMRRKGDHGMHSAGRAPQLMRCGQRAGDVAHLMFHPLFRVLIERVVDHCMDPPVKGELAQVSCMWTQKQARCVQIWLEWDWVRCLTARTCAHLHWGARSASETRIPSWRVLFPSARVRLSALRSRGAASSFDVISPLRFLMCLILYICI